MLLGAILSVAALFLPAQAAELERRTFWANDGNNAPFVGCYNTLSLWPAIIAERTNQASGDACAAYCNSRGIGFAYYYRSTKTCKCALGEPAAYLGVTLLQNGYGRGGPNSCPEGYWDTRVLRSRYTFKGCTRDLATSTASFNSFRDRLFFKALTVKSIFRQGCSGKQFLVTRPTTLGILSSWYCYGDAAKAVKAPSCDQDTYYIYGLAGGPTPSGLRRRDEPLRDTFDNDQQYLADQCNKLGYETCWASEAKETWECVDTSSANVSCGGCRWGAYKPHASAKAGTDCSAVSKDSTCIASTCRA